MGRNNKDGLNNNKHDNFDGAIDKAYYEKYKAKIGTHSHRGLTAGIVAAIALTAIGGLVGGHFAYKAGHNNPQQETIDQRIVIDPITSPYAEVQKMEILPNGDASCILNIRKDHEKTHKITGVKVRIGSDDLAENEYSFKISNRSGGYYASSNDDTDPQGDKVYQVTIYKSALDKHQGKVTIEPQLEEVKYTINFYYDDADPSIHKEETVETRYVCYGKTIVLPEAKPEKPGYTFTGKWALTRGETDPDKAFELSTQIVRNYDLYAMYGINLYTVTFDLNGGTGTADPQTVEYKGKATQPDDPTRDGYDFEGWYLEDKQFDFDTEITRNITLVAKWEIRTYTITFNNGSYDAPTTQHVKHGEKIGEPTDVAGPEEGWVLEGWYTENTFKPENKWNFEERSVLTKDVQKVGEEGSKIIYGKTLYSHWVQNKYDVTLDLKGGTFAQQTMEKYTEVPHGATIYLTVAESKPTKTGYTFDGWFYTETKTGTEHRFWFANEETGQAGTQVKENLTITAKWTQIEYTLQFYKDHSLTGDPVLIQPVKYGNKAVQPNTPEAPTGHKFVNWKIEGEDKTPYDFDKNVEDNLPLTTYDHTKPVKIYADWEKEEYTVTFEANGGEISQGQKTALIKYQETVPTAKAPTVTRKDYSWNGKWYTDPVIETGTEFLIDAGSGGTQVTSNITLYAHWTVNKYTVTYNVNGAPIPTPAASTTTAGGTITTAPTLATWAGHELDGWYEDPVKTDKKFTFGDPGTGTTVSSDITLFAHWTNNTVKVTYNGNGSDGGTLPSAVDVIKGQSIATKPTEEPTRTGYLFEAWYDQPTGGNKFEFGITKVTADTTLYAHWTYNQVTVTFHLNGGTGASINSQTFTKGKSATEPGTQPSKAGCIFDGWYDDPVEGTKYVFGDAQHEGGTATNVDTVLYAHYKTIEEYYCDFTSVTGGYKISAKSDTTLPATFNIPNIYNGLPVKEIGSFGTQATLNTITIPSTVTSIDAGAFSGCNALTSATFGDTDGWYYGSKPTSATDNHIITRSLLQSSAASLLKSTPYNQYAWTKVTAISDIGVTPKEETEIKVTTGQCNITVYFNKIEYYDILNASVKTMVDQSYSGAGATITERNGTYLTIQVKMNDGSINDAFKVVVQDPYTGLSATATFKVVA